MPWRASLPSDPVPKTTTSATCDHVLPCAELEIAVGFASDRDEKVDHADPVLEGRVQLGVFGVAAVVHVLDRDSGFGEETRVEIVAGGRCREVRRGIGRAADLDGTFRRTGCCRIVARRG